MLARARENYIFPSVITFSMAEIVEMQQDSLSDAPLETRVKSFEVGRLDQGIWLPIDSKTEHLEDLRSDSIVRSRLFPAPWIFIPLQSSETGVQFNQRKEGLLSIGAAGHNPNREKQGNL
jgi:hypothetical protein